MLMLPLIATVRCRHAGDDYRLLCDGAPDIDTLFDYERWLLMLRAICHARALICARRSLRWRLPFAAADFFAFSATLSPPFSRYISFRHHPAHTPPPRPPTPPPISPGFCRLVILPPHFHFAFY